MASKVTPAVMRRGLQVLGVAIRTEKAVFAAAVVFSALYGGMTVASAWALGWATENVVLPAFKQGEATTGTLALGTALILGVSLLKAMGVAGRRFLAGVMQYRMQAHSRRAVTRQYLKLPLAWHHRHPTGQLLSNASADAEAAWAPLAPLPMAVGVIVMLVTAAVAMVITDPVLALVGFLIFPAIAVLNLVYQRKLSPWPPGPSSSARRSARSRTRASTAPWSSRPSAVRPRRPTGSGPGPTSCATPTSPSAGSAACSTRCWRHCPRWACSRCC